MARLIATGTGTLDAAGEVSVTLPAVPAWETWMLGRLTVDTRDGDGLNIPRCTIYEGSEAGGVILDDTYTGNSDVSDFSTAIELPAGMFLTAVWSGGSLGEIARVQLYGERIRGVVS